MHRVANHIVMVVSRWLWVVGLRPCARRKCTHRVAKRFVMVVSRLHGKVTESRDFSRKVTQKRGISIAKWSESDRK